MGDIRCRSLIEACSDPLVIICPAGKIIELNQATVNFTGLEREKLLGSDFINFFIAPQMAREMYEEVIANRPVKDRLLTLRHQEGRLIEVLLTGSVYQDNQGKVLGAVVVAKDIAGRKWADELIIANQELAFQNDEKEKSLRFF